MNVLEAAVAHDQDVVAGFERRQHRLQQYLGIGEHRSPGRERLQGGACIPAEVVGVAVHLIGIGEAAGERSAHHAEFHGVGARLEHGNDALAADAPAQAFDGLAHGRGVMGEVVIHRNTADDTAFLHAPLYALEVVERIDR